MAASRLNDLKRVELKMPRTIFFYKNKIGVTTARDDVTPTERTQLHQIQTLNNRYTKYRQVISTLTSYRTAIQSILKVASIYFDQ